MKSVSLCRVAAGVTLAGTVALTGISAPAAPLRTQSGTIALSASAITFATKVPSVHGSLPLFRLQRTAAPTSFLASALGNPGAMGIENTRLVARDGNHVMHAFADTATGDAQIFPSFASSGAPASPAALAKVASAVFARSDVIPGMPRKQSSAIPRPFSPHPARSRPAARPMPHVLRSSYLPTSRRSGTLPDSKFSAVVHTQRSASATTARFVPSCASGKLRFRPVPLPRR